MWWMRSSKSTSRPYSTIGLVSGREVKRTAEQRPDTQSDRGRLPIPSQNMGVTQRILWHAVGSKMFGKVGHTNNHCNCPEEFSLQLTWYLFVFYYLSTDWKPPFIRYFWDWRGHYVYIVSHCRCSILSLTLFYVNLLYPETCSWNFGNTISIRLRPPPMYQKIGIEYLVSRQIAVIADKCFCLSLFHEHAYGSSHTCTTHLCPPSSLSITVPLPHYLVFMLFRTDSDTSCSTLPTLLEASNRHQLRGRRQRECLYGMRSYNCNVTSLALIIKLIDACTLWIGNNQVWRSHLYLCRLLHRTGRNRSKPAEKRGDING